MSKRLFFLATLMAVFAASIFVGRAFAYDVYDYQPEPNLECKGAQDKEWMRASLGNESGDTIHFKRWYRLAGSSTTYIDNDWVALWNNQANHMSFVRQWPDDLRAIGWDVQEEGLQPDVYVFNQANYCGY